MLLAQCVDHASRLLAGREPALRLTPQRRPRVRPGLGPLRLPSHTVEVGGQRRLVPLRPDPRRPPYRVQARNEVAARPSPLELITPVRTAEPDRNAVRQVMLRPRTVSRTPTDRAHRQLPDPRRLVVALRHNPILTSPESHRCQQPCQLGVRCGPRVCPSGRRPFSRLAASLPVPRTSLCRGSSCGHHGRWALAGSVENRRWSGFGRALRARRGRPASLLGGAGRPRTMRALGHVSRRRPESGRSSPLWPRRPRAK